MPDGLVKRRTEVILQILLLGVAVLSISIGVWVHTGT